MTDVIEIRAAAAGDAVAVLGVLEPVIRAGETYALPRDMKREDLLAWWMSPPHEVYVAVNAGRVLGTYFIAPNQRGGGSHVANCGYVTGVEATGCGVARAMCAHSLELAKEQGYRAMQFNFVVSTNVRAVRLWESFGFETVGRLPGAFLHPDHGFVDALVMYRLEEA